MAKKYQLVLGNNYPGKESELNGCINDLKFWEANYRKFGFAEFEALENKQNTAAAFRKVIPATLKKAKPGDFVNIAYSAHGTIVPPGVQSWVPYDFEWDKPDTWFTYDEFDRMLMAHEDRGVIVCIVSDSCHSKADPRKKMRALHKFQNRFLPPPANIQRKLVSEPFNRNVVTVSEDDILLSGCRKDQTSADAEIDDIYRGAFTYSLGVGLKDFLADKVKVAPTYNQLIMKSRAWLAANDYDQVPSGDGSPDILSMPFFSVKTSRAVKKTIKKGKK